MRRTILLFSVLAFFIQGCWMSFNVEIDEDDTGTSANIDTESDSPSENPDTETETESDTETESETETESDTDTETSTDYCADSPWEVERIPINMFVLVDRSRSMAMSYIGSQTYAEVVADALSQTVATYDNSDLINFGLAVFPSPICTDYFDDDWHHVCLASSDSANPVVEIEPDNSSTFQSTLNSADQCGGTPTCQSLIWAESYLSGGNLDPEITKLPTYVLLATDGAPNCNPELDVDSCINTSSYDPVESSELCLDHECTYDAAKLLADSGHPVFVLGVGDSLSEWDDIMNTIAEYGETGSYYPANSVSSLQTALDEIANESVSCTYNLDWEKVPEEIDGSPVLKTCGSLALFGRPWSGSDIELTYMLDCDDENTGSNIYGWNWQYLGVEPEELDDLPLEECTIMELCPHACDKLKVTTGGWETVTAQFTCIQY